MLQVSCLRQIDACCLRVSVVVGLGVDTFFFPFLLWEVTTKTQTDKSSKNK